MRRISYLLINFLRSAVGVIAAVGLFCVCASQWVQAQPSKDKDTRYEVIDELEGARRLDSFRRQRLQGDYCFQFQLEHLPRRAKTIRYNGIMWGSWNEQGAVTRLQISTVPETAVEVSTDSLLEIIIQNGREPSVWKRTSRDEAFVEVKGEALFEPLVSGIVYTPFDIQMPFVFWDQFDYEGPDREGSVIVQRFLMRPPVGSVSAARGVEAVRVSLHDKYDALYVVEMIGDGGEELSRFSVEKFKKIQQQYIVKAITLKDNATRDRTRFLVKEASVGLNFDPSLFDAVDPLDVSLLPAIEFEQL